MKIIITKDYDEMSKVAANIFEEQIKMKPNSVLGLATGGTPEEMYKILVESNKNGLSWENVRTFNLDEYIGIPKNHEMSYHTYMQEKLLKYVDIKKDNINIPKGEGNIEENSKNYDDKILKSGGIDLQVLGIGENAHIAFNEPGSSGTSGTREVSLTKSTIDANSRYFAKSEDVPRKAISMGIGSILKAKKIILLASGIKKAKAIKDTIEGKVTKDVPSSFLQNHKNVTLIIDKDAASLLTNK